MIRLALKGKPPTRLSLDGIIPEKLAGLSQAEIARLPLALGNRSGNLGDWFSVQVTGEAGETLVISGTSDRLDHIGAGMGRGEIRVEGDAGAYAGMGMAGGVLAISGSALHGAAMAMAGGELRIGGDAGDQLGGARPGENWGMREGIVIVAGSAGAGVGDRMRRGLIAVAGGVGAFCGARMIAGTVVVGGGLGDHPGLAMRRGTIVALDGAARVPPSFADCGTHELVWGRLLALRLVGLWPHAPALGSARLHRWAGDLASGGKGEILIRA
jgi:formylmethanofuran dehydrogenase subunit C